MSFQRYNCPACGLLVVIFDDAGFVCRNPTCGTDAAARRNAQPIELTREEFMRQHAIVYYLALGNRIKIGTSTDLPGRMKAVPHEELVAFEFGSYKVEHARHRQFAHARIKGEWFARDDEELAAWIENLRAKAEDPSDIARSASRAVKRRILGLAAA